MENKFKLKLLERIIEDIALTIATEFGLSTMAYVKAVDSERFMLARGVLRVVDDKVVLRGRIGNGVEYEYALPMPTEKHIEMYVRAAILALEDVDDDTLRTLLEGAELLVPVAKEWVLVTLLEKCDPIAEIEKEVIEDRYASLPA